MSSSELSQERFMPDSFREQQYMPMAKNSGDPKKKFAKPSKKEKLQEYPGHQGEMVTKPVYTQVN